MCNDIAVVCESGMFHKYLTAALVVPPLPHTWLRVERGSILRQPVPTLSIALFGYVVPVHVTV
jgi:hypothetical protein